MGNTSYAIKKQKQTCVGTGSFTKKFITIKQVNDLCNNMLVAACQPNPQPSNWLLFQ
jgi:hypothetical protein